MTVAGSGITTNDGTISVTAATNDLNVNADVTAGGAGDGMTLVLNVAAMLLAFIALVAMLNAIIEGITGVTLDWMLGKALSPVAFLIGIEWKDAGAVGSLMGTKMILNEFLAYTNLAAMVQDTAVALHPRSAKIAGTVASV